MARNRTEQSSNREPEQQSKRENQPQKRPETPTSFIEDLLTLFKLRFLKQKLNLSDVDQKKIDELETKSRTGSAQEKEEADKTIGSLFEKLSQLDNTTRPDVGLVETLRFGGERDQSRLDRAQVLDANILALQTAGSRANKEDIKKAIEEVKVLSVEMGVNLEKGKKKDVESRLNIEIAQLHELRDKAALAEQRELLQQLDNARERRRVDEVKREVLAMEDFKQEGVRNEERRMFKARKRLKQKENQEAVDHAIRRTRDDFEGDRLKRLSGEEVLKGYLTWRTQGRYALSYVEGFEGGDEVELAALKIASVYAEEFAERLASQSVDAEELSAVELEARKSGAKIVAMGVFQDAWIKRGPMEVTELEKLLGAQSNKDAMKLMGDLLKQKVGEKAWFEDADYLAGMNGRSRGHMSFGKEAEKFLISNDIGVSELKSMYQAAKDEAVRRNTTGETESIFSEMLRRRYGNIADSEVGGIYRGFKNFEGDHHYRLLQERLDEQDYKGYVKELIAYLYRVGLREGRQDFQLGILMRQARTILAENGQKELLEWYENFEKMAMSHEQFMQLDAEGYGKTLNFLTHRPWEVFLDEYADTLSIEVKEDGERSGELGIWQFHDMLMNEAWAEKLLYTSTLHEDEVYQEMVATHIFGKGEICKIDKAKGIITDIDGNKLRDLNASVKVDGVNRTIAELLEDGSWMVATAHDLWRYSGNAANVLDDVDFTKALGMNKGLLGVWKIRRYAEQYGFVQPYMLEALGMDNYLYSFENYKGLVAKGMTELLKNKLIAGQQIEIEGKNAEVGDLVKKVIHEKLRRLRRIGDTELRSNYISADDVNILARRAPLTFEQAKKEFIRRQRSKGKNVNWNNLNREEVAAYNKQINNYRIRWNKSLYTSEEWKEIDKVNWAAVNTDYERRLGLRAGSMGNTFEDFLRSFSFSRLSAYHTLRATDMKDFGNYFARSEAVTKTYKSGFHGGATKAMVEIFGSMEGYLPYDTSGFRKFARATMEQVFGWHKRHLLSIDQAQTNADGDLAGKKTKDGKLVVDEYGQWEPKGYEKNMLLGKSLLEKDRFTPPYTEREVEYSVYFLVNQGIISRTDADLLLNKKFGGVLKNSMYGGKLWRWVKRWIYLDDPLYWWEAAWTDGKKAVGSVAKYIFSG